MAACRPDFGLSCAGQRRTSLATTFHSAPATPPGSRGRTSSAVGLRVARVQSAPAGQAGRGCSPLGPGNKVGTTFTTTIKESK